jgi:hypothetical protein
VVYHLIVQELSCRVVGEAQDSAAVNYSEARGPMNEGEAQRFHTRQLVGIGTFR